MYVDLYNVPSVLLKHGFIAQALNTLLIVEKIREPGDQATINSNRCHTSTLYIIVLTPGTDHNITEQL